MDPYLRNKDWLYGLGRTGCTCVGVFLCQAGLVVATFGLLRSGLLDVARQLVWLRYSLSGL